MRRPTQLPGSADLSAPCPVRLEKIEAPLPDVAGHDPRSRRGSRRAGNCRPAPSPRSRRLSPGRARRTWCCCRRNSRGRRGLIFLPKGKCGRPRRARHTPIPPRSADGISCVRARSAIRKTSTPQSCSRKSPGALIRPRRAAGAMARIEKLILGVRDGVARDVETADVCRRERPSFGPAPGESLPMTNEPEVTSRISRPMEF